MAQKVKLVWPSWAEMRHVSSWAEEICVIKRHELVILNKEADSGSI